MKRLTCSNRSPVLIFPTVSVFQFNLQKTFDLDLCRFFSSLLSGLLFQNVSLCRRRMIKTEPVTQSQLLKLFSEADSKGLNMWRAVNDPLLTSATDSLTICFHHHPARERCKKKIKMAVI